MYLWISREGILFSLGGHLLFLHAKVHLWYFIGRNRISSELYLRKVEHRTRRFDWRHIVLPFSWTRIESQARQPLSTCPGMCQPTLFSSSGHIFLRIKWFKITESVQKLRMEPWGSPEPQSHLCVCFPGVLCVYFQMCFCDNWQRERLPGVVWLLKQKCFKIPNWGHTCSLRRQKRQVTPMVITHDSLPWLISLGLLAVKIKKPQRKAWNNHDLWV